MKRKKYVLIILLVFFIIWTIRIIVNVNSSKFEETVIKYGDIDNFYGADVNVLDVLIMDEKSFLENEGEEYSEFFVGCEEDDTKVVEVEVNVKNNSEENYSLGYVTGAAYLRINRGYATYLDPYITSIYNDITSESKGILAPHKERKIKLIYTLNRDSFPNKIWRDIDNQTLIICYSDEDNINKMKEFELEVSE